MSLDVLIALLVKAAEVAESLGLREALTVLAVLEQVRHVKATGNTLDVRDLRTRTTEGGNDHG